MTTIFRALLGALALCAASAAHAAPASTSVQDPGRLTAPVSIAVFHPDDTSGAAVQTVQYRRHYGYHHRRPFYRGRVYPRRFVHPYRGYYRGGPRFAHGPYRRY